MFKNMIRRWARSHPCRNTRLQFDVDRRPGFPDWLLVRMIDKCTGAVYEAEFSPATADQVLAALTEKVHQINQT
jgi:hypothetical protein